MSTNRIGKQFILSTKSHPLNQPNQFQKKRLRNLCALKSLLIEEVQGELVRARLSLPKPELEGPLHLPFWREPTFLLLGCFFFESLELLLPSNIVTIFAYWLAGSFPAWQLLLLGILARAVRESQSIQFSIK